MAITLLTISILFVVAIWVYEDAKERGMDAAALYTMFSFGILIIGLPYYLYQREKHPIQFNETPNRKSKICPKCRWANEAQSLFC